MTKKQLDNIEIKIDRNKKIFIIILILAISLPFIVFLSVYFANVNQIPVYEKKDVLMYYGTIIGACFTGIITAGGLYLTFKENHEELIEQRNFDLDIFNAQKAQFDTEYNLKLINQKLERYKEIYLCIENIINTIDKIINKIPTKEELERKSEVCDDVELICEGQNKLIFLAIFITEEKLINMIDDAKKATKELVDFAIKYTNSCNIQYNQYISKCENTMRKYKKVSNGLIEVSREIYQNNISNNINNK